MRDRPRFFCENCGIEVPLDAKNCPRCGRRFASVRCPSCDFVGEESLFTGGCPLCGYSPAPGKKPAPGSGSPQRTAALPLWVYVISALALFGVLAAFIFFIR